MIDRRTTLLGFGAASIACLNSVVDAQERPSWHKLPAAPYKGKQDDIVFVDLDHGWYGNGAGKLYRTTDGGESWAQVAEKPGTYIRALGFIDRQNGFLGNVGANSFPGATDAHPLYRTRNGGVDWEPIAAPGIDTVAGICGIHILPPSFDNRSGRRSKAVVHAAGRVSGPAMIMRSDDAGETWRVIDLSDHAGMILDVHFASPMIGFVAASAPSETGEGEARILATSDGGRSWQPVYRSGRTLENVWKTSWPSPRIGYASIQAQSPDPIRPVQRIIKTADGGRTWRELPLVQNAQATELGIGFLDNRRGWVGTRNDAYETTDGGKTWSPVPMGTMVNKIRVVRGRSVTRIFAIGREIHRLELRNA